MTPFWMKAMVPNHGPGPYPEYRELPGKRTQFAATTVRKVGRNDPCPCGSNLKYKRCCGNPLAARAAA